MEELRLRISMPPNIIAAKESIRIERCITSDDLHFCMNAATKYSPWTSQSITQGFITAAGGHRIGICGECVYDGNLLRNISPVSSICIRVARQFRGASGNCHLLSGSILIIGCPGSGKTTFLRDLIYNISHKNHQSVTVVDQRKEIFPCVADRYVFERGEHTDILSGCNKMQGLEMAIRTMNPDTIAVDEITSQEDCSAIIRAAWCGVRMIATAHANSKQELKKRKVYRSLLENNIFEHLIILHKDKTWHKEVM